MPPLTESMLPQGSIMIVDDNPANLKLLDDMLREHDYEVRSFPRGRLALAAAEQAPPDLILLDINMPEMNGYEVCEHLKSDARLGDIPVIFLSALNAIEDKVKGFQAGGVDYIAKPFQLEEVQARVETHLKLYRAQQVEHALLERTLGGTVGILWELVQLTSPILALRSQSVRGIVQEIAQETGISDRWQYELAASLCFLGCVAVPEEVFKKAYCGETLSANEDRMFRAHPDRAARLLASIPRLETVARIIRGQLNPEDETSASEPTKYGAHMLHLALELDQQMYRGVAFAAALAEIRTSRNFDGQMLNALEKYSPDPLDFEVRRLSIRDLRPGMVLASDVVSNDGNLLILKEGTVLSGTWIERLENFSKTRRSLDLVDVRVPRVAAIPSLTEHGLTQHGPGVPDSDPGSLAS